MLVAPGRTAGVRIAAQGGTWKSVSSVRGIGGIGDGRPDRDRPADAPRLTIDGVVVFGGFGITSEVPEEPVRGVEEAIAKQGRRSAPTGG